MRRAELRLATNLYWREDWSIGSRATVVAPTLLDRCEVTVLRVDATPALTDILDAQAATFRKQVDSIIPIVGDFRPIADSVWRLMQKPVAVDSSSTAWLTMSPAQVNLAPIVGTGSAATTSIFLTAHPKVVVGTPPTVTARPLPQLSLARPAPGIHLPVEIEVPFADVSRRATASLAGEVAGKGITIKYIDMWGVGDTAVVRVDVTGRLTGSLYLLGRVGYDHPTRSVTIGDLRYTLESAGKMANIKANFAASRIRSALNAATGHGRLAIGEQLDRVKAELTARLNQELSPGVRLSGSIDDVRIERFFAGQSAFVLRVVLDGKAQVVVER